MGLRAQLPSLQRALPCLQGIGCSGSGPQGSAMPVATSRSAGMVAAVKHSPLLEGWTWPWVCRGAPGPSGHLRLGVCDTRIGSSWRRVSWCPTGAVLSCGTAVGNTATWDFGLGAVMKFLGRVSVQEACCQRCLPALVNNSLTSWCFAAQEPLSHPKFPDMSLSQGPPNPSHCGRAQGWHSFGERQHRELGCSCPSFLRRASSKAPSSGKGLHFYAGSVSSRVAPYRGASGTTPLVLAPSR